ncbi:MAG: hypothetical protein SGCHY_003088 [Lobulomycetales sp.]
MKAAPIFIARAKSNPLAAALPELPLAQERASHWPALCCGLRFAARTHLVQHYIDVHAGNCHNFPDDYPLAPDERQKLEQHRLQQYLTISPETEDRFNQISPESASARVGFPNIESMVASNTRLSSSRSHISINPLPYGGAYRRSDSEQPRPRAANQSTDTASLEDAKYLMTDDIGPLAKPPTQPGSISRSRRGSHPFHPEFYYPPDADSGSRIVTPPLLEMDQLSTMELPIPQKSPVEGGDWSEASFPPPATRLEQQEKLEQMYALKNSHDDHLHHQLVHEFEDYSRPSSLDFDAYPLEKLGLPYLHHPKKKPDPGAPQHPRTNWLLDYAGFAAPNAQTGRTRDPQIATAAEKQPCTTTAKTPSHDRFRAPIPSYLSQTSSIVQYNTRPVDVAAAFKRIQPAKNREPSRLEAQAARSLHVAPAFQHIHPGKPREPSRLEAQTTRPLNVAPAFQHIHPEIPQGSSPREPEVEESELSDWSWDQAMSADAMEEDSKSMIEGPGKSSKKGDPKKKRYACDVFGCLKTYRGRNGLMYHRESEHGGGVIQRFLCPAPGCGCKYKNPAGLKYHIPRYHPERDAALDIQNARELVYGPRKRGRTAKKGPTTLS